MQKAHNEFLGPVDEFFRENEKLVAFVMKKANLQHSKGLSYEELHAAGLEGMLRAYISYDPSRGCRFSTFAYRAIKNQILKIIREQRQAAKLRTVSMETVRYNAGSGDPDLTIEDSVMDESIGDLADYVAAKEYAETLRSLESTARKIMAVFATYPNVKQTEAARIVGCSQVHVGRILKDELRKYRKAKYTPVKSNYLPEKVASGGM